MRNLIFHHTTLDDFFKEFSKEDSTGVPLVWGTGGYPPPLTKILTNSSSLKCCPPIRVPLKLLWSPPHQYLNLPFFVMMIMSTWYFNNNKNLKKQPISNSI